jgi:hypothetical protein
VFSEGWILFAVTTQPKALVKLLCYLAPRAVQADVYRGVAAASVDDVMKVCLCVVALLDELLHRCVWFCRVATRVCWHMAKPALVRPSQHLDQILTLQK